MSQWKNRVDLRIADKIRRVRESGVGYKTIAQRFEMTLSHVQSICKESRPAWWKPTTQEKVTLAVKKWGREEAMRRLKLCGTTVDIAVGKSFDTRKR